MFSFTDLIGLIYPYIGYISLMYIGCVAVRGLRDASERIIYRHQKI